MNITVFVLLVAFLPCISSSPTPSLAPVENNNKKMISDSNAFMYDQIDSRGDSPLSSASVHERPSSLFYDQPRSHANQFLMSHVNDNQIIVPKWFTRFNNNNNNDDDDDDMDDYVPSGLVVNKRSSFFNPGGYQILKKTQTIIQTTYGSNE